MSFSPLQKPTVFTKIPAAAVEMALFFALAVFFFSAQVFYSQSPLLTLLFDSQGYLWAAEATQKALNPDSFFKIISYIASGSPESQRAELSAQLPGLHDLLKTGPLLPAILASVYTLVHKKIAVANWSVGAISMILFMALTVLPCWIWGRKIQGLAAARIAAFLTIGYSAFAINSGRILSEVPAISISTLALLSFVLLISDSFLHRESIARKKDRQRILGSASRTVISIFVGILIGLMMLARPTLLLVPPLMIVSAIASGYFCRQKKILRGSHLLGIVLGILLVFAPWVMTKQILTGTPSIMVERYGPYNLSAGLDLRTDGWDALPSEYVSHPDRFKSTMSEVLRQISREAREQPIAFVQLLLRKPCRLVDSPWNDFQNRYLGLPYLMQRLYHQIVLLAGTLGIIMLFSDGWKRRNVLAVSSATLLTLFCAYHFVSCVFISMSRYFVTAMPALIVGAAYFLALLMRTRQRFLSLAVLLLAPIISMLIEYLIVPGYGRLSDLSSDFGLIQTSWFFALVLSAVLALSMIFPALRVYFSLRGKVIVFASSLAISFICLISTSHQIMCSEAVLKLGAVDRHYLRSTVNLPAGSGSNQWFLVMDANDSSSFEKDRIKRPLLSGINVRLNDRQLEPDWAPLLAFDSSRREDLIYMSAFAYSANKPLTEFRQWIACPLPQESIKEGAQNSIEFTLKEGVHEHPKVFADFCSSAGQILHTVSLTEFSWSKGFFANSPGEMRLDKFANSIADKPYSVTVVGPASKLKARIFLLGLRNAQASAVFPSVPLRLKIPDKHIGPHEAEQLSNWKSPAIPSEFLSPARMIRITMRGELRSNNPQANGSVALIEQYKTEISEYNEFCPLAAQKLPTSLNWSKFEFQDFVSGESEISIAGKQRTAKLSNLQLIIAGRPWWECLAYGIYKSKSSIEFRNMELELESIPRLDMNSPSVQWYELNSQFERE